MPVTLTTRTGFVQVNSDPLWAQGGDVATWAEVVTREMVTWATKYCPPNRQTGREVYKLLRKVQSTGALLASIEAGIDRIGRRQIAGAVAAGAVNDRGINYAKYVLEGTMNQGRSGYIYTTKGYGMKGDIDHWVNSGFFEFGPNEKGLTMNLPVASGLFLTSDARADPGTHHRNNLIMRVRGQKANPFLTDAYIKTALRHSALPRKRFKRTAL